MIDKDCAPRSDAGHSHHQVEEPDPLQLAASDGTYADGPNHGSSGGSGQP